jgi:hypothetical protein
MNVNFMKLYFLIALLCTSFNLFAQSNSELFKDLEIDSPERKEFLLKENSKVVQFFNGNKYVKPIAAELKKIFDIETTIAEIEIAADDLFHIVDLGLNKGVLVKRKGKEIFATTQLSRKGYYQLKLNSLSPDKKYFFLSFFFKGSIDDHYFVIGNAATGEIQFEKQMVGGSSPVFWVKDHIALFSNPSMPGSYNCYRLDAASKDFGPCEGIDNIYYANDSYANVELGNREYILDQDMNMYYGSSFINIDSTLESIRTDEGLRLIAVDEIPDGEQNILTVKESFLSKDKAPVEKTIITLMNQVHIASTALDDYYLIQTSWGLDRSIFVYKKDGSFISKILLPRDLSMKGMVWKIPGKELTLKFRSFEEKKSIDVSLDKEEVTLAENLLSMKWDNMEIVYDSVMVKSFDGTMVPVQILKDKNFKEDGARPAFILTYGGFGLAGYLFTSATRLAQYKPFLERGGLLVLTGVRGGNEYGLSWRTQAKKEKKGKTFEDVASVAKYLIDSNLSQKEIIALHGSSNGGYVVASTGLLYSQYFGLIVPHAGVHDQLAKKRLDARFRGWAHEYLDEDKEVEKELIPDLSPLEIAKKPVNLDFFILTGKNDSRVNPSHSYKLYSALVKSNQGKTLLYSISNNGHWETAASIGRFAAIRDWSLVWALIFKKYDQQKENKDKRN